MKAPDELIVMVLFGLLLKRINYLANFCLIWAEKYSNEKG